MGTDFLLEESRYQQRIGPGQHHPSIVGISHCSTPLLGCATQWKPRMEELGCTTSVLQKNFGVVFHLSWEYKLQMTDQNLKTDLMVRRQLSPFLPLQRGAMLVTRTAPRCGRAPGGCTGTQAGSVPKAQLAQVASSPADSVFSHHTCAESSAFQDLLVPLLGTGDGF